MNSHRSACLLLLCSSIFISTADAQWVPTNGPYGGEVNSLVMKGTNIFAGSATRGVFVSTDSGHTWSNSSAGLSDLHVNTVGGSGMNLFAGTGYAGLFRSTDDGASWHPANSGLEGTLAYAFLSVGPDILAGTFGGLFRSSDGGVHWVKINTGLSYQDYSALAASGKNLIAGSTKGISLSPDSGSTWSMVDSSAWVRSFAAQGPYLFAGTRGKGVLRSADNGLTWTPANSGLSDIEVDPLLTCGTGLYAGTTSGGVFRSTDTGATWHPTGTVGRNEAANALLAVGPTILVGTSGTGILQSADGGQYWSSTNNGLTNTTVKALALAGHRVFAATDRSGVFASDDSGGVWFSENYRLPNGVISAIAVAGSNVWTGVDDSICLSPSYGGQWRSVATGLGRTNVLCFLLDGSNVFAGLGGRTPGDGGVCRSTDGGATWTRVNSGLPASKIRYVNCLAKAGTNIFAGLSSGGVFVSANNGTDWTPANHGLSGLGVKALAVIGTKLFAATGGVYFSSNFGADWTSRSGGLTDLHVAALAASGENLFAGTDSGGVFLSTDEGVSWTSVDSGLTAQSIQSLAAGGPYLFAGMPGIGVWRRPLAEMITQVSPEWIQVDQGLTDTLIKACLYSNGFVFAATKAGVFRTSDQGAHWTLCPGTLPSGSTSSFVELQGTLFLNRDAKLFRSSDAGQSWDSLGTRNALCAFAPYLYALSHDTLCFSTDLGSSWSPTQIGGQFPGVTGATVLQQSVFAMTSRRGTYGVWMSPNNPSSWIPQWADSSDIIYFQYSHPQAGSSALFMESTFRYPYGYRIWRSTDRGYSWAGVWAQQPAGVTPVGLDYVMPMSGVLYGALQGAYPDTNIQYPHYGYSVGIFKSTDDGAAWMPAGEGLPEVYYYTGLTSTPEGYVFAATNPRGIWRTLAPVDVPTFAPVRQMAHPAGFVLYQNYPNPFNPSTKIRYEIPAPVFVRLSIYDILGREVAVLVNERKIPGVYEAVLDASRLSTGVYFYRMQAGTHVQVKKLMTLK